MRCGPAVEGKGVLEMPDCWKNSYPRKKWTYLFFDEKWEMTKSGEVMMIPIVIAAFVIWWVLWYGIVWMLRLKPDATAGLALLLAIVVGIYGATEAVLHNRKTGLWLILGAAIVCGLYNILTR